MVEYVERLPSEFQVLRFGELELLREPEIEVEVPRSTKGIVPQIAISVRSRIGKGAGVKPIPLTLIESGGDRVSHQVRGLISGPRVGNVRACDNFERYATRPLKPEKD